MLRRESQLRRVIRIAQNMLRIQEITIQITILKSTWHPVQDSHLKQVMQNSRVTYSTKICNPLMKTGTTWKPDCSLTSAWNTSRKLHLVPSIRDRLIWYLCQWTLSMSHPKFTTSKNSNKGIKRTPSHITTIVKRLRRQENRINSAQITNSMLEPLTIRTVKSFHLLLRILLSINRICRPIDNSTTSATWISTYFRITSPPTQTTIAENSIWRTLIGPWTITTIYSSPTILRWTPQPCILWTIQLWKTRCMRISLGTIGTPLASTRTLIHHRLLSPRTICRILWEKVITNLANMRIALILTKTTRLGPLSTRLTTVVCKCFQFRIQIGITSTNLR